MRVRSGIEMIIFYLLFTLVVLFSLCRFSVVSEAENDAVISGDRTVVFKYQIRVNKTRYLDVSSSVHHSYNIVNVLADRLGARDHVIVRFTVNNISCFLFSKVINVTIIMNEFDYTAYLSGRTAEVRLNISFGGGHLACLSDNASLIDSIFGSLVTDLDTANITGVTGARHILVIGEFNGVSGSLGNYQVRGGRYLDEPSFFVYLPYMSRVWGKRGPYLAGYTFIIASESVTANNLRFVVPIVINSSWPADWLGSIYVKGLGNLGFERLMEGRSTVMGEYHFITAKPEIVDMIYESLYERGDDFVTREALPNGTALIAYDPLNTFVKVSGIDEPELGRICQRIESGGNIWMRCRNTIRLMGRDYATNVMPTPATVSAVYDSVTHALVWFGPWDAVYGISDRVAAGLPKTNPLVYVSLLSGSILPIEMSKALEILFSEATNKTVAIRNAIIDYYHPGKGGYVYVPVIELSGVGGLGSAELRASFTGGMQYSPPVTTAVFVLLSFVVVSIASTRLPKSATLLVVALLIAAALVGLEILAPPGGHISSSIGLARGQTFNGFGGCGDIYLNGYGNITLIVSNQPTEPYNVSISVMRHDGMKEKFNAVSFQALTLYINASPGLYTICVSAIPLGHEGFRPPSVKLSAASFVNSDWRTWRWWGMGALAVIASILIAWSVLRRWLR